MNQQQSEIMRPKEVATYLGVTTRQVYNLAERDPEFPRKIVFSPRHVGWRRAALDEYLKRKEAAA